MLTRTTVDFLGSQRLYTKLSTRCLLTLDPVRLAELSGQLKISQPVN